MHSKILIEKVDHIAMLRVIREIIADIIHAMHDTAPKLILKELEKAYRYINLAIKRLEKRRIRDEQKRN